MRLRDLDELFDDDGFSQEIKVELNRYFKIKSNMFAFDKNVLTNEELKLVDKIDKTFTTLVECTNTDFNFEVIKNLKTEIKSLNDIMRQKRTSGDFGTYKNIINAYSEVLRLIDKYDWKQMYSVYKTHNINEEPVDMIAVWEQNSEGQIRNHRKFQRGIEM